MTDKELLEFAANAAGYELIEMSDKSLTHINTGGHDKPNWNPLNDDGDALRLAVNLNMNVFQTGGNAYAMESDGEDNGLKTSHKSDKYAATRRAITRAAAEIGKAMTSAKQDDKQGF